MARGSFMGLPPCSAFEAQYSSGSSSLVMFFSFWGRAAMATLRDVRAGRDMRRPRGAETTRPTEALVRVDAPRAHITGARHALTFDMVIDIAWLCVQGKRRESGRADVVEY